MNCRDFKTIAAELARSEPIDAKMRDDCLDHVKSCSGCRRRLDDERALSASLRALAEASVSEEIPPGIEASLLEAYRQTMAGRDTGTRRNATSRFLALAAAIVAVAGISFAGWRYLVSGEAIAPIERTPPAAVAKAPTDAGPAMTAVSIPEPARVIKRLKTNRRKVETTPARDEIVTEFVPVVFGSELIPLESGQVVRVLMPRSTLISMGFPLNQDRADESIMADVLVGGDGTARAVRLVY